MLRVGDLVQVTVNDRNFSDIGIVIEYLSSSCVSIYIGDSRYDYPCAFLDKVESQGLN